MLNVAQIPASIKPSLKTTSQTSQQQGKEGITLNLLAIPMSKKTSLMNVANVIDINSNQSEKTQDTRVKKSSLNLMTKSKEGSNMSLGRDSSVDSAKNVAVKQSDAV